tara:strand:+ start:511 stop:921 length:411 start_codon:yes stop_codon:yes gene_type:complete
MINSLEADIGDCCYFLLRGESKPKYGTITAVHPRESAVQVMESADSKFYIVWENNAAWEEKELKGQKWEKPHNYHRDIPEDPNEKKPDERKCDVHHRKKRKTNSQRSKKTSRIIRKGTSSKQKTLRRTKRSKNKTS